MTDLLRDLLRSPTSLALVILLVAVFGQVPTGLDQSKYIPLDVIQRALLGLVAVVVFALPWMLRLMSHPRPPASAEWESRFREAQEGRRTREPLQAEEILAEDDDVAGVRLSVVLDRIEASRSDVLVSSDDNYLQAAGGVAKAILQKAGSDTLSELKRWRRRKLAYGHIAITGGGATSALAIFHPAVIDLDTNRFPKEDVVQSVVRKSLRTALALGGKSIAFPLIGSGTGSLDAWQSISVIVNEIVRELYADRSYANEGMKDIAIYVSSIGKIKGDLRQLVDDAKRANISSSGAADGP